MTGAAVGRDAAAWRAFFAEIARWRDSGRTAEFWWRDDDAGRPAPALSRLFALAKHSRTPLALAVVPLQFDPEILRDADAVVSIVQHGTDHANRAVAGEKKTEFSAAEPPTAAVARLASARERLATGSGGRFVAALAPPWNRMPQALAPLLADAGFRGISQYGARRHAEPVPGLRQVNTHVDIIDWHAGRRFAGAEAALAAATRHLAAKRAGTADADEPTGWLTHHAVHDEGAWVFLERLFESTRGLAAVAWRRPEELFNTSRPSP